MKKLRLISLVLVVAMLCSLTLPAAAVAPSWELVDTYSHDLDVFYVYTTLNGIIIEQYTMNVLTARVTIDPDNPEAAQKETFLARSTDLSTIYLSDFFTATPPSGGSPFPTADNLVAGNITFYGRNNAIDQYYGIRCTYRSSTPQATTQYTNGSFNAAMDVLSACALVVAELYLTLKLAAYLSQETDDTSARRFMADTAIALAKQIIAGSLPEKVDCTMTEYSMTLYDRTNSQNYTVVTGREFCFTAPTSSAYGATYTEGYVPAMWGTAQGAHSFHNLLFPTAIYYSYEWWN